MNTEITPTGNQQKPSGKSRRGFASMSKERHKLVSSKGGKSLRTKSPSPKTGRHHPSGQ